MAHNREHFPSIGDIAEKTDISIESNQSDSVLNTKESSESSERPLEEVTSLCMQCGEQGITRLLLTSIPYFREVIVMSFRCDHCGTSNNEIQSAGTVREEGTIYTARILFRSDLNRQIVRSSTCVVQIPEYELTLPPSRGQLTTIEGLLRDIVTDLATEQPLRRIRAEAAYVKIQSILDGIQSIIGQVDGEDLASNSPLPSNSVTSPITIILDDPAGSSFIEFVESMADSRWNMRTYRRTAEQNIALGFAARDDIPNASTEESLTRIQATDITESSDNLGHGQEDMDGEVYEFPGKCSSCGHSLVTRMKKVIIPHFKDILIMSTNCDRCGYRDNEVKSGTAISALGKRITLKVIDREDLSRDILKSETSGLSIPEIDLVLQAGTLGGRFTTVEGILHQIYEELSDKVFASGDSSIKDVNTEGRNIFDSFLKNLKQYGFFKVANADRPFTLILDDPLANSYVQNLYAPDPDPNMEIMTYERTWQQNEELGINDMKVEGYET
ncbi:hypothetical protein SERLA73DRAFT_111372 [Serpula lacrymans var. lacrymans S7.3]|uniref:Zinc finger ZPR1-type domain-containing protein n=2 Tax=Serpula lacrymans var. lacrymans TaxID=341189 RepID=F8Q575_SERL3|nr:uncharacterized protein SERLADRAFT_416836 [Serpula lacrymans var. lacrymans S7.9]EGN96702.1 hypothetical protein SERLA73DRAFT_111372 [Serpula lacrymans var. lacrymans S7.3]EGO22316.1 hypothetical protein SERLADRAFT_416836 [Serpula lacrymans var. lacrymans S7.9]